MVEALVLIHNWLRSSLFVDTTTDLNKVVEDNDFMDQLTKDIFCKILILIYFFSIMNLIQFV